MTADAGVLMVISPLVPANIAVRGFHPVPATRALESGRSTAKSSGAGPSMTAIYFFNL